MYTYTPKPNRKPAILIASVCFFTAIAMFVPYPIGDMYLLLLRSVAMWSFFIGYVTLERYAFTSFLYVIEVNESVPGQYDLKVVSIRYKRRRTVCRISVSSVKEIYKYDRKDRSHSSSKKARKYNYCPDMAGDNRYILAVEDDGEAIIRFCPDEKMANLIKNITNRK